MGNSFENADWDEEDREERQERSEIRKAAVYLDGSWTAQDANGKTLIFETLEAANKYASEKWENMQEEHYISGFYVPSDEEDEQNEDTFDYEQFCTAYDDGRAHYERKQRFYVELDLSGAMHEALRTTTLEVVQVRVHA